MSIMKILYISDPRTVGGATRSLVDIVISMKDKGVECIVCTSIWNEFNEELNSYGIDSFACGHYSAMETKSEYRWKNLLRYCKYNILYRIKNIFAIRKIEKEIDLKEIDLIHTNSARNDIGAILNKKYKIPHIVHIREFGKEDFDCWFFKRNYGKYLSKYTVLFIAISKAVADSWIKRGIEAEKIEIIYNGVDDARILKRNPKECNIRLRMVMVGGVCEAKCQKDVILALERLSPEILKKVSLDIIGWGAEVYLRELGELIRSKHLEPYIHLLGAKENIGELLKNYDIGFTCSRAEGFGRVTAEYMHAGLGIIASDKGANPELIIDKKTGLLYKYGDTKELAKKIEFLFNNRELIDEYGRNAHRYAMNNFRRKINADSIYQKYLEIVNFK